MPARLLSSTPSPVLSLTPSDSSQLSFPVSSPPSSTQNLSPTPPLARRPSPPPDRARRTTVRNRRLQYLKKNESAYFSSPDLELADPLLYDRLIRQFQTAEEREADGRARGWSGILEADINRAEAKIAARAKSDTTLESRVENEFGEEVTTKEEGRDLWKKAMTLRFLQGKDEDVDYNMIDNCEDYDDHKTREREREEEYFDAETPSSVSGDTGIQDY